jgi:hypothetical protein
VQLSLAAGHVQHIEKLIIFIHIYILIRYLYSHTHIEQNNQTQVLGQELLFCKDRNIARGARV